RPGWPALSLVCTWTCMWMQAGQQSARQAGPSLWCERLRLNPLGDRARQPGRSIMTRLVLGLSLLAVCTAHGVPPGGKLAERRPTYGGGPVVNSNAVKYSAESLKTQNVPEITTDNKNTLVRKYPGKLLLSASSVWQGWEETLAFDDNPHS